MAGIQSCFRKFLICNSSRLINKNGILLQPSRGRHYLVFHISSPQNRVVFQTKKFCYTNKQFLFRLASTNVTVPQDTVSDTSKTPTKTDTVQEVKSVTGNEESKSSDIVFDDSTLPPVPEVEITEPPDMEFVLTGLKEPTFETLGLGSFWPSGIIQQVFEYLHVNLELPWWQAIVAVTFAIRIALTPVVLKGKIDGINMLNNLPELHKYQERMTQAKLKGDYYAVANETQELQKFIKEKNLNMFSFLRTAIIQGPIFLSMYYALNGMAKAPVESLKTDGLFWFTDLTAPDPYYILPVLLSTTLLVVIEIGAEGTPSATNTHAVKWIMRAIPLVALVFTARCSSCIAFYWTVSNTITLLQASAFKIPAVRKFLNMPEAIRSTVPPKQKKGFIQGFKEGFENVKITQQIQDRERMNMVSFQNAGTGPVPKTFKKNPLLQKAK